MGSQVPGTYYKCSDCSFTSCEMAKTVEHLARSHPSPADSSINAFYNAAHKVSLCDEKGCYSNESLEVNHPVKSSTESLDLEVNYTEKSSNELKWSQKDTMILIRLVEKNYARFDSELKKNVWQRIAVEISRTTGKNFTSTQCDSKWKALKTMYKKILDYNNNHTGVERKEWEYLNPIHEFLYKKPEIVAPATCSSSDGVRVQEDSSSNSNSGEGPSSFGVKRKTANLNSAANKRHKEKLERQDRFLNLYEKLVNFVTKDADNNTNQASTTSRPDVESDD